MANDGLNLLLVGQPGATVAQVAQTLKGLARSRLRLAPSWPALEARLAESRVDCVVICLSPAAESDEALIQRLRTRLRELVTPAVIVLERSISMDREPTPALNAFDVVVGAPYDPVQLGEAVQLAITLNPTREGPKSGPSQPQPETGEAAPRQPSGPADPPLAAPGGEAPGWPARDSSTALAGVAYDNELDESGFEVRVWGPAPSGAAAPDAPGAASESEPTGAGPDSRGAEATHLSELPHPAGGDLSKTPAYRVLLTHGVRGSTGVLRLEHGGIRREIAFSRGEPGLLEGPIDPKQSRKTHGALLWQAGQYSFREEAVGDRRFHSLGSTLGLIHAALHEGLSLNQASMRLTEHLQAHATPTRQVEEQRDVLVQLTGVPELLDDLGRGPIEEVVTGAGGDLERVLKDLVFCIETDLVTLGPRPLPGPVAVRYQEGPRHLPRPQPHPSSNAAGSAAHPPAAAPAAASEPKPEEDNGSEEALERLATLIEDWRGRSAYQIFDLEEGCGAQALRDRYYELVREHHPDTFGLARLPEIKPLAEMVFRLVQKGYNELRRLETGPPVAGAGTYPDSAGEADDETPSTPGTAPPTPDEGDEEDTHPNARPWRPAAGGASGGDRESDPSPVNRPLPPSAPEDSAAVESTTRMRAFKRGGNTQPRQTAPSTRTPSGSPAEAVESPEARLRNGINLIRSGAFDRAVEELEAALEARPTSAVCRAHLCWARFRVDPTTAEERKRELRKVIEEGGVPAEHANLYMGHILGAEGDDRASLDYYRQCLILNPNNVDAMRRVRLSRMRRKRDKKDGLFDRLFSKKTKKSR